MRLWRSVVVPLIVLVLLIAAASFAIAGPPGGLGALIGGALTLVFLGSSPGLLEPVARRSPTASLPVALGFYALKAVAALGLLAVLLDPAGLGRAIDERAVAAGTGTTALAWTALHFRAFSRSRTPTFDLRDSDE